MDMLLIYEDDENRRVLLSDVDAVKFYPEYVNVILGDGTKKKINLEKMIEIDE
jgi:hypothetical protein